jgi:hypothetical protein
MIYVGIDDTDTLDDPGTNQLARHLVRELRGAYDGRLIVRHQLLEDPRVPCTKKNGCASILFESKRQGDRPVGGASNAAAVESNLSATSFVGRLRDMITPWCPQGSDPGLCVAHFVPQAVVEWGLRCQRELVTQAEARAIAAHHGIHLEGLGGTQDGVIGALAAVGLMATGNDGRVVHFGASGEDWYDVTGCMEVPEILARGVDEVRTIDTSTSLASGTVDVGKRLRPNFRDGRVVLFVAQGQLQHWEAVRVP